jgi:hypothetical protein
MIEPRKWRAAQKFTHCAKYAIYNLSFSSVSPRHCFVNGLDFEVLCGRWDKPVNNRVVAPTARHLEGDEPLQPQGQAGGLSFRGDSKWVRARRPAPALRVPVPGPRQPAAGTAARARGHQQRQSAAPDCAIDFPLPCPQVGMARAPDADVVVGLGESGNAVVARLALAG